MEQKNKNLTILLTFCAAIAVLFIFNKQSDKQKNTTNKEGVSITPTTTPTPTLTMQEQHMQMFDDGKTVMMMGGDFSPKTIYATPGATVRFLNHESTPHALMADDHKSFMAPFIEAGGEVTVKLPMTTGSYPFHIHDKNSDKMLKGGTIIIEAEKTN